MNQQSTQQTEQKRQYTETSYDDINYNHLNYDENYVVNLGAVGQLIKAIHVSCEPKDATNDYQKILYPALSTLCQNIVSKYQELFLNNLNDSVQKSVYGANLNGLKNDGTLKRLVLVRGVQKILRYKYAQFGHLVKVLNQRLEYIVTRDPQSIERYVNKNDELTYFLLLQEKCKEFMNFLNNDVITKWDEVVKQARTSQPLDNQKSQYRKFNKTLRNKNI